MEAATVRLDGHAAPERSHSQRMDALDRANHIRMWRSKMKHDLKAGRLRVADLLGAPSEEMETMKVIDLLLATPKIGRVKAMKMLAQERISPSKSIGGLSERQRAHLLACLRLR